MHMLTSYWNTRRRSAKLNSEVDAIYFWGVWFNQQEIMESWDVYAPSCSILLPPKLVLEASDIEELVSITFYNLDLDCCDLLGSALSAL